MKTSYKKKLFFSFLVIFFLFATGVVLFEQSREKEYKTQAMEEKLDAYAGLVDAVLTRRHSPDSLSTLLTLFPPYVRLSVIDGRGWVIYDNVIKNISGMENHAERPEIVSARKNRKGRCIRTSSSNEQEYLYYAKRFDDYYVRVALPYDVQVQNFLKSGNLFLYYIIILFGITLFIIHYASGRFSESIRKLRDFAGLMENGDWKVESIPLSALHAPFPEDELGEIGRKIAQNYQRLETSGKEIRLEREKLLQHIHSSEEGICFFSADKTVEFYNGLFIHYLNTIVDGADSHPDVLFSDSSFEKATVFLAGRDRQDTHFEMKVEKQGKTFAIRVNVFDNGGFEIVINDITRQEKTRLLKQEMTGNITHELRTPVTAIRGCLETVLEHSLDAGKERYFIQKAYRQVLSLSELIQDMGLITKIENAPHSFRLEPVELAELLEELKIDLEIPLHEKNIRMEWTVGAEIVVTGNRNLLYSIFRNLTDNVIRYAGTDIRILIRKYSEDKLFYYFSYADNGAGVPGEHLNRLFERFYRVNEGRTRDTGGSGLGLSIVRNAILFHRGTVTAKNRAAGGLEFLFKLPRARKDF